MESGDFKTGQRVEASLATGKKAVGTITGRCSLDSYCVDLDSGERDRPIHRTRLTAVKAANDKRRALPEIERNP